MESKEGNSTAFASVDVSRIVYLKYWLAGNEREPFNAKRASGGVLFLQHIKACAVVAENDDPATSPASRNGPLDTLRQNAGIGS